MTRGAVAGSMVLTGRLFWAGIVGTVVVVAIVVSSIAIYVTALESEQDFELITVDVPRTMAGLERAIGYGGFIHDFKNHVLRADEGQYGDAARRDYETAIAHLDQLEAIAGRVGIDIETADLRDTLADYRSKIDTIDRLHAQGATSGEIDAAVRLPDEAALLNLSDMHDRLNAALSDELQRNRQRILALVIALIAAFIIGNALIATIFVSAQRKRTRDAERISALNARLNTILETAQNGILGLAGDGTISLANPGARAMLPAGVFDAGANWPDLVPMRDAVGLAPLTGPAHPLRRATSGEALRESLILMGDDAAPRYVRLSSARISNHPQEDVHTVVLLDDVTELERNRQQVERAARLDALGQLTGGIAHDFNNLLGTIEYAVELARSEAPDADNRYLDTARNAVRRGADLTRRLLTFAKRQPGQVDIVSVSAVMASIEDLSRPALDASIGMTVEMPDTPLWIRCDEGQLENALLNIVLNSRDAIRESGQGSTITIGARVIDGLTRGQLGDTRRTGARDETQELVELSVSDDGPGMSAEVRRRATDPFFTTKAATDGSGLGLSMVYGFVEQSGGIFKIYSEVGRGTTIRLLLPAGKPAAQDAVSQAPRHIPRGRGEHILVVDDQADLLAITRDMLLDLGYRVTAARSGAEALERIASGGICDLLLTDVVMPGMGGFELAAALRAMAPKVPVIYMSGYTGISERQMGAVIAPVVQKPCPPADLALEIRAALAHAGAP